jgi:hypothetical protein
MKRTSGMESFVAATIPGTFLALDKCKTFENSESIAWAG